MNNKDLIINFVSYQRMLNIATRLIECGGTLNKGEIHTLRYIFSQLDDEKQGFILHKYGEVLTFLYDKEEN